MITGYDIGTGTNGQFLIELATFVAAIFTSSPDTSFTQTEIADLGAEKFGTGWSHAVGDAITDLKKAGQISPAYRNGRVAGYQAT